MALMAGATIGSGVIGGISSLVGGGKASSAAKDSANLQKQMYLMNVSRMAPFTQVGQDVVAGLPAAALVPGTETQAQLEATPGYQFTLSQGLKSVQSANAAKGLGVSGAALKGAAQYATGLASNTYQNIFNQQQQRFSNLLDIAKLGESAAAGVGVQGTAAAANVGNALQQAGQYQASGGINATNALTQAAQNYLGYDLFQKALAKQTGGTVGPTGWNTLPATPTPTQPYSQTQY